jgi:hypothetical protein
MKRLSGERISLGLRAVNELNCVATAFNSGVADDETGFEAFGSAYCHSVDLIYDLIVLIKANDDRFRNIIELYGRWQARLEDIKLEEKIKKVDAEKRKLHSQKAQIVHLPPNNALKDLKDIENVDLSDI